MSFISLFERSLMFAKLKSYFSSQARARSFFFTLGISLMIALWLVTDPDAAIVTNMPVGAKLLMILTNLSVYFLYVLAFHWSRKFIFDYFDLRRFLDRARETPEGSGLAVVGMGLFCMAFAIVLYAATARGIGV